MQAQRRDSISAANLVVLIALLETIRLTQEQSHPNTKEHRATLHHLHIVRKVCVVHQTTAAPFHVSDPLQSILRTHTHHPSAVKHGPATTTHLYLPILATIWPKRIRKTIWGTIMAVAGMDDVRDAPGSWAGGGITHEEEQPRTWWHCTPRTLGTR